MRPTSVLAVVGLVSVAVAPPVGLLLAWLALKETHPVTGTRGGRDLAVAGLWLNGAATLVLALVIGSFVVQLAGFAFTFLGLLAGAPGVG